MPSVTEILDMLAKPALVPWAVGLAVKYCEAHAGEEGVFSAAKTEYRSASDAAMDIGSVVHHAIESHCAGCQPDFSGLDGENREKALVSYQSFLAWEGSHSVRWLGSEIAVRNSRFYAGKLDALANVDGVDMIIDVKTSNAIYNEYFIQLAMYQAALEWTRQNPSEYLDTYKMPHKMQYHGQFSHQPEAAVLRVPKDGGAAEFKTMSFEKLREKQLAGFAACVLYYGESARRLKGNKVTAAEAWEYFGGEMQCF